MIDSYDETFHLQWLKSKKHRQFSFRDNLRESIKSFGADTNPFAWAVTRLSHGECRQRSIDTKSRIEHYKQQAKKGEVLSYD